MPVYLSEIDDFSELDKFGSVLIVPCRFCPAASMAVTRNEPYFEVMRHFLKTASYEQLIQSIKSNLIGNGVKADVFRSNWLHQFALCMWSSNRRKKLAKMAEKYEALLVLGCEAAVETVQDSVGSLSCRVYQGMRTKGIMNILPRFNLPCNISIQINGITPLLHQDTRPLPWIGL